MGSTRVSQSRIIGAAIQSGMPARHRSRIEWDLMGAHYIGVMIAGLLAAVARVFLQGQGWRFVVYGLAFVVTLCVAGNALHLYRYLRARRLERRQFQQWVENRDGDVDEAPFSSDRDFVFEIAVAVLVTIWVVLNAAISG
jgi:hypothetical protein